MATVTWSKDIAETYDAKSQAMFEPALIGPTIDLLTEFAGNGSALEFAIGTGRVGLALAARGTAVDGIDLSPHMVEQLQRKPGANAIAVTIGDMATTRLGKTFKLVYLVFNTIMNVTTQDEQVAVFESAAAHLKPGGHFLVEVVVPQLRQLPKGGLAHVFEMTPDRLGFVTFDDVEGQISWSNSWINIDGRLTAYREMFRYVWPAELDLMARISGLRLKHRWGDWTKEPFTNESESQIAVYEKPILTR